MKKSKAAEQLDLLIGAAYILREKRRELALGESRNVRKTKDIKRNS